MVDGRMRIASPTLGLLALAGAAVAALPVTPPTAPFEYALFARGRLVLREGSQVRAGQIGANARVVMQRNARVFDSVAAISVRLAEGARARRFFCYFLDPAARSTCRDFERPLVAEAAFPPVAAGAGSRTVRVPAGGVLPALAPGSYDALVVGERAGALLDGGTYVVRTLRLGRRAQLVCTAPCTIQVQDRVRLGARATMRGQASNPVEGLRVEAGGAGARAAVRTGVGAAVTGIVYAPNGRMLLGPNGDYHGRFVAQDVVVGARTLIDENS